MKSILNRSALWLVLLSVSLAACSLPKRIGLRAGDTPAPEAKALMPATPGSPPEGTASPPAPQLAAPAEAASQSHYGTQTGTPVGVANFAVPEAGCSWLGVGGQVFNLQAEPVTGIVVEMGGNLAGKSLEQVAITGGAQALGPAGFLIVLGDQPVASQGTLWLQLFDEAGAALSEKVYFDTYPDCGRNLTLVNFAERITSQSTHYLPFVGKQRLYYFFPYVGQR